MLRSRDSAVGPIVVTMGEPAGIGGEIALKAWANHRQSLSPFVVLDDPDRLSQLAEKIGADVPIIVTGDVESGTGTFDSGLPVLPTKLDEPAIPGTLNPANAGAVRESIERAVELVRSGAASAMVTNPINKLALYGDGFEFPGHTEFLAHLCATTTEPVMMLASPELRVIPVTRHVAISEALTLLTAELIEETVTIVADALRTDFGHVHPRLAIAGLNPHAGEGGTMGREELDIIGPAIERLRAAGFDVSDPMPPDTMFHAGARRTYDAAICMYHDQALIPIKTIDFDRAVNVTLGLPIIRTSPDHGTALDIAGTGEASETSLVAALQLASAMAVHRADTKESSG